MWKSMLYSLASIVALIASGCTHEFSQPAGTTKRTLAVPAPAPVTTAGVTITLNGDQITSVRAYYSNRHHRTTRAVADATAVCRPGSRAI